MAYTRKDLGSETVYTGGTYVGTYTYSIENISFSNGQMSFTMKAVVTGGSGMSRRRFYYKLPSATTWTDQDFGTGSQGTLLKNYTINGYGVDIRVRNGQGGSTDAPYVTYEIRPLEALMSVALSGSFAAGNLKSVTTRSSVFSGFTYSIVYSIGSKTETNSSPGTSVTKNFDTSWYAGLPTATSGTLTVTASAKAGSETVFTETKTLAVTIPDSVKPSISACTFADNAGYSRYIKSLSAVKINSMTYAVGTGSTLKSISIKVGTQSAVTKTDGTYPVSGTISATGSLSVLVTVTDNRSRSATYSTTITAYEKTDLVSIALSGTFAAGNLKAVMSYTLPKSSGYSATVTYTLGSKTETPSSFAASTTKTFDSTWYAGLPSATTGTLQVVVTIKEGTSTWTTKTATLSVTIPDTVKPSISAFAVSERLTTVPSSWGIYVQGLSALKISTLTAAAGTGASISKVKLKVGSMAEKEGTMTNKPVGDAFTSSGNITVTVTVVDSRNRSATSSVTVTVYAYSAPAFNSASSVRCNASSVADDEGTRFKVTTGITYSSCNGKNSVTLKVQIKPSTSSTYGTAQTISPNTTVLASETISANYAYDVRLTLTDQFNTSYHYDYISTALYMIHFKTGGNGIAFGQKATIDDTFDCNFAAAFRKGVTFTKSGGGTVTIDQIIDALGL